MAEALQITVYLLAALFALCCYVYWFCNQSFKYWKQRNIPYIQPIIPFGNTQNLYLGKWTLGELFAKSYLELKKRGVKHGGIFYFWKPIYIPVDTNIIKHILISDFDNFTNHGLYINPKDDPLSGHIFNMEDTKWKTLRSKMPSAFTSSRMRKMSLIMAEMTKEFKKILDVYEQNNKPINIKQVTSRFTIDIISSCGFGMESNTMKYKNEQLVKHGRSFFNYQWNLFRNTMVFTIPRNILQSFKFRIFRKDTEEFILKMFKDIKDYRKEQKVTREDLANILINLMEKNDNTKDFTGKKPMEPLDLKEFATQMFVLFAAGFETSSGTQTFAVYELAKNPECQTKLRKEINEVLSKHDNKITYDAVMEMPYLESVIDETLRMHPVFPILPRVCKEDYKIPGTDLTLEKNTLVMVTNMGIQKDPEYYPNPDQFDPDRFSSKNKGKIPFIANLPFGEGPRICVGKRFGLLQSKMGLITMVRNYEISLSEKTTPDFKYVPWELILRKAGDIWINLKKIQ